MRLVDFLTKARWTKGSMAKDAGHRSMDPNAPEACRWCLAGAIELCYPDINENAEVRHKICRYLRRLDGSWMRTITHWNDNEATWPAVKKMLAELQV